MDFVETFSEVDRLMYGFVWSIVDVVRKPNLEKFEMDETDSVLLPTEYVWQVGCGDYGYSGTVLFPTTYSDGDGGVLYIRVDFTD